MIRMLESEQYGKRFLTWESSVPATVYFNCEDVVWKESASLTDQEKRELLTDIIQSELHIEFNSFCDADWRDSGVDVAFVFDEEAPVKFNKDITQASQEVRMDIIYEGRIYFDFDIEDDPERAKKALDAQMKKVSEEVWDAFTEVGIDPVEYGPAEYGEFLESAYCYIRNGTEYAPNGQREKFKYPPQAGDLRVYGYDFD